MGLINTFKSIFGRRKEEAYEDIDESQIPKELKSLMEKFKDEESMKHSSIRHQAEHDVIPHIFFNKTKLFLDDLERVKEGIIHEILLVPYRDMNEESPYNIEDFKIVQEKSDSQVSIIKLSMPSKNIFMGNCYRIYFTFDKKLKRKQYFTVEERMGTKVLCSIDKKGNHHNYGDVENESMEIDKIMSIV